MSGIKKILHVGCGSQDKQALLPQFREAPWQEVRLDIDPRVTPDIVADMRDMHPVETGSMDAVWSSHNIEHLYPHEVPQALSEFHRVLKEDGMVILSLPDIQRVMAFVAEGRLEKPLYQSPSGPISALDMLYGHRASLAEGNLFMAHKTGFTASSLAGYLLAAGFSDVTVAREGFDLQAVGAKREALSQPRDRFQLIDKGGPRPDDSIIR